MPRSQRLSSLKAGIVLGAAAVATPASAAVPESPGDTVIVEITDEGFRPGAVTVRHGDVVRFLQHSGMAHNVEFVRVPQGTRMAPEHVPVVMLEGSRPTAFPPLRIGPYLMGVGEIYDLRVDHHLAEGVYEYRCASHEHRGLVIVFDGVGA